METDTLKKKLRPLTFLSYVVTLHWKEFKMTGQDKFDNFK